MTHKTQARIGALALTALAFATGGCDEESSTQVTHYQFCGEVKNGSYYDSVAFFHQSLFKHDGKDINLSTRIPHKDPQYETSTYCTEPVQLPAPLPASFYNSGKPSIKTWAKDRNGTCFANITGSISASNDNGTGTVIVRETYDKNRIIPCPQYGMPESWPAPAVPGVIDHPSSSDCVNDVCVGGTVLTIPSSTVYQIGSVTGAKNSVSQGGGYTVANETMRFKNEVLYSSPAGFWWSGAAAQVRNQVKSWGAASEAPQIGYEVGPPARAFAEVRCIGSVCEGQSAELADESGTVLVGNLFGSYFEGYALGIVTREGQAPAIEMLEIEEIEQIPGVKPTPTTVSPEAYQLTHCATGTLEVGCDALLVPFAASERTGVVSIITRIRSLYNNSSIQIPILEHISYAPEIGYWNAPLAPDALALNREDFANLTNNDWAQSSLADASICNSSPPLDFSVFCRKELTYTKSSLLPAVSCLGPLCEGQELVLRGTAGGPGKSIRIQGLFGDESRGYAWVAQTTNWKLMSVLPIATIQAMQIHASDTGKKGADPSTPPSAGQSIIAPPRYSNQTITDQFALMTVVEVGQDASVTGQPVMYFKRNTSETSQGNGRILYTPATQWNQVQLEGAIRSYLIGSSDSSSLWDGWSYSSLNSYPSFPVPGLTDVLVETPCIRSICEGQRIQLSQQAISVHNLFGNETRGYAFVSRTTEGLEDPELSLMSIASLLPLVTPDNVSPRIQ